MERRPAQVVRNHRNGAVVESTVAYRNHRIGNNNESGQWVNVKSVTSRGMGSNEQEQ